jgi:ABC-2 type transport system permease protein
VLVEWSKQVRRLRTRLGLGAMIVVPGLVALAFQLGGSPSPRPGETVDFFAFATRSGLNFAVVALLAMSNFFLLVVVALFTGETVAGEATWGSLRYLLVRPVARPRLLASKLAVAYLLSIIATLLVSVSGLAFGTAFFGWRAVTTPLGSFGIAPSLGRLGLATLYVAWSMSGMAGLAFFLSTTTDAVIGPVGGTVCLAVVSEILDQITALGSVRYGLPTHYWQAWTGLFSQPVQTADMWRGVLLQVPYVALLGLAAWRWFARKDILS